MAQQFYYSSSLTFLSLTSLTTLQISEKVSLDEGLAKRTDEEKIL